MVEGGIHKADKTELTECWRTAWRTPYIMKLALSAGIGGLLFGYDTGLKKKNQYSNLSSILFYFCIARGICFFFFFFALKDL